MITHVFDTSAILAHYFEEPGADQVNALLAENAVEPGLPAVALLELKARLAATVRDAAAAARAFQLYSEELIAPIPVTREIVARAEEILRRTDSPLTMTEAITAATARHEGALLVHRSPNLARIPGDLVRQCALPFEH